MSKSKFVNVYGATKRATAAKFRAAANLIEKRGWVQHRYEIHKYGFCLLGAKDHVDMPVQTDLIVKGVLGLPKNQHVSNWNDAPHRSKEDVVRILRRCAAVLEHGGQF